MKEINFNLEKDINTIPAGSSLICNIEFHPAIVYGKLKSLFGEPTIETINLEEQYYYCLSAQMESGKTFTMANVIAQLNKPTLIISHNKTLAAQLYGEFKEFFPENAVEYFVS